MVSTPSFGWTLVRNEANKKPNHRSYFQAATAAGYASATTKPAFAPELRRLEQQIEAMGQSQAVKLLKIVCTSTR